MCTAVRIYDDGIALGEKYQFLIKLTDLSLKLDVSLSRTCRNTPSAAMQAAL